MSSSESLNTGRQFSLSKSTENQDMNGQRSAGLCSKSINPNTLAKFEILYLCALYLHVLPGNNYTQWDKCYNLLLMTSLKCLPNQIKINLRESKNKKKSIC